MLTSFERIRWKISYKKMPYLARKARGKQFSFRGKFCQLSHVPPNLSSGKVAL
jgi:hypothetical protein